VVFPKGFFTANRGFTQKALPEGEAAMRKEQRLTKPQQYSLVYRKGISRASNLLVLRALPNGLATSRYGFSVSKRVGNAVTRNHIKRLLREISPRMPIKSANDIVFIVRPPAASVDYGVLKKDVEALLARAGLLANEAADGYLAGGQKGNTETV